MAVVLGMSACGGYTVGFMWVLGTQYNQIAGFKIDDYTGNLTQHGELALCLRRREPGLARGARRRQLRLRRQQGHQRSKGSARATAMSSVFAVGEDGVLTFQTVLHDARHARRCGWRRTTPAAILYVLDQQAPDYATTGNGDITVFAVDGSTGRLQLVPNQLIKNAQGQQLNYFEVGPAPTMLRVGGACVYTLDSGDQTIFPTASAPAAS